MIDFEKLKKDYRLSRDYYEIAMQASDDSKDLNISNCSILHAKFLLTLMFSKARQKIKIYTGSLDNECYEDPYVKSAINKALNDNVKIEIISDKEPKTKISNSKNVEIRVLNGDISANHFTIVDDKIYRYEEAHGKVKTDRKANVNFNDRTTTILLNGIFDMMKLKSKNVS
ncbi:MAG: hypothetical protein ACOCXG_00630 [Nanoarchaeota archaeon]